MPPDMLTLILVMAMGALGGTINLTRLYLKRQKTSDELDESGAARYLFQPLLGSITALAVLILAKAGVLIVASPTPNGGASLSPFFISFLGIVSGLMADTALDAIQKSGKRWFTSSVEPDLERWAYGLRLAIESAASIEVDGQLTNDFEQKIKVLEDSLGVPAKTLSSWLN